jgi:hypothetical protein
MHHGIRPLHCASRITHHVSCTMHLACIAYLASGDMYWVSKVAVWTRINKRDLVDELQLCPAELEDLERAKAKARDGLLYRSCACTAIQKDR